MKRYVVMKDGAIIRWGSCPETSVDQQAHGEGETVIGTDLVFNTPNEIEIVGGEIQLKAA